jgi:hypothetical protein
VHLSFGYDAARNLRLLADFGAQYHSTDIVWTNGKKADADDYQLLFGPELTLRNRPTVTPFVHGLVGLAFRHYAVPLGNWICTGFSCYQDHFDIARKTGFASGVGGGLDWQLPARCSGRSRLRCGPEPPAKVVRLCALVHFHRACDHQRRLP